MAEHYTRNTIEATAWCNRCNRVTLHRVDGVKKGPCIDPQHPQPPVRAQIPQFDPQPQSGDLFESREPGQEG